MLDQSTFIELFKYLFVAIGHWVLYQLYCVFWSVNFRSECYSDVRIIISDIGMGLLGSREAQALQEARRIRENLYARVTNCLKNHQHAFQEISPNLKRKVLHSSALEIADMLDNREATTLEVVYIFIERTAKVGVKNNYVFDEIFQEAIAEAFACDQQRARDGHSKKCWRPGMKEQDCYPPFFGVPASIKQTMVMKNRQIHVGFVAKVNPLPAEDGLFMIMVRKMGFIPFVRSNVPQACKTMQTNNNIFGYCLNPWNITRSCGGSSGGESGMVASYCSPIGFGSDIGGSLRVPAAFTGLVTLKPAFRYSRMGNCYYGKFTGGIPLKSEMGPITRTVQDTILVHQYLYNQQNYTQIPQQKLDPFMNYIPLNMSIVQQPKKMKIGVMKRLKHAHCSRSNQRAVDEAVRILEGKGHEIMEVRMEKLEKLYFFIVNLFLFDQNMHLFSQFKGDEPLIKQFRILALLTKIPWFIRRLVMWFLAKREPRLAQMIKCSRPMTGTALFERVYQVQKIISPQVYKIFAANKLDAVVLPTFVTPAPRLGQIGKLQYFFSFASAWNVLCYPVATIPVTVAQADQTQFNDQYNDHYTRNVRKQLEGSEGLPVGIQIASTPYNEQKIMYLMKELEGEIGFREKYRIPE